ncbi:4-hydroxybenzoate 3-monooxygenase [Pseudonocardia sp. GCM10023141]|uniref:4-hydroxybenzoate 3-monooxygenase n=1 Tax=Pseudonocardia sp. GCM10023141 TaxID=3252653 RepID=UPI00361BC434
MPVRTQVAVIGAGPAGLVLAHLLRGLGIDAVVLEARSRGYVEARIRAGVLEQGTVDLLRDLGAGARLDREALVHDRFELRLDGERHLVPVTELAGVPMTVYGQQEIVRDLIALRLDQGEPLLFDAPAVEIRDVTSDRPVVVFDHDARRHELVADAVVAADGFHGIGRRTIPAALLRTYEREHPFAWLGVMAQVPPSSEHVVYANHPDGLGMLSMRSTELTRLYLQVEPDALRADWPDRRIWEHLHRRLATTDGWELTEGPIVEFGVAPIRSFVAEPMRHGRMFLAGDAAHIVPPTGAKGLNLAVRDVRVLAPALAALVGRRDERLADAYSATCLRHVWWAQYFSSWLTGLMHTPADPIDREIALAELRTVVSRPAALQLLAENYVGTAGGLVAATAVAS